ncbi:SpvB/TcaC N-terminal domain-containing protein [Maribacter polysaccharolyticus]|uniref:SpvB/TcaC N-terminal domain-containing protein n=1 Tax=Maribacter polysaccharolyticus TaxID=3020831 RepID=UPI00237FC78C|nr:SpvB/TcaC N-terminal domain-containing protein [Maribacter polysaccharolyticus]MDE3742116.1 SpvB/TcaC N-terminal domain-containing protein [Maribacter polysaccharolyticus]
MKNEIKNTGNVSDERYTQSIASLTKEEKSESNAIEIPSISLPKGGGALKGIDEKFKVNPSNGTSGLNIPLPLTPGRNGFSPSLSLSYNSGSGNSHFGLGWSLNVSSIQRKTDKKLPRYEGGSEEDIFMFTGTEDLVPYLNKDNSGNYTHSEKTVNGYVIKRYRPRVEGGFARIERIFHKDHGIYWKVTTRDNIATIFGRSIHTRISNPDDTTQIFKWLPEFSYDDKGNWIQYVYKREDLANVPNILHEKNRLNGIASFTNSYLKKVKYGNRKAYYADPAKPYDPQPPIDQENFFELVLDFGEHDPLGPTPTESVQWPYRQDAFSSFRSGFEIRTNRLCKRILMFHHFKDEKQFSGTTEEEDFGENYLVRSLDMNYGPSSINDTGQTEVTYLTSITQSGYVRKPNGTYSKKSLPPMEFRYEKLNWNNTIKTISEDNIMNAPLGLTNNYQLVDLYGEGISGILKEEGNAWYYKSNLGVSDENGELEFTRANKVISKPSFSGLSNGILSLQDLEANGEKQVVIKSSGIQGFFELNEDNDWKPFQSFKQVPNINLQEPHARLIDLNGDGQPEIVVTEENAFIWYASNGKKGHLPAESSKKSFDEEKGPAIVFADQEQSIFLADMSGDGLTDIVRIRNHEICYWANKGYGNFSAKITMNNAPNFDHPDAFNPKYLHLADVSGTGATDIVYLGKNDFKAYLNLSGNAWSDAHRIDPFFPIDSNSRLSVADLLGTGTSCLIWSSDLPDHTQSPMRFIDLMDSKKPHVLTHYKNNFGKETTVQYKSSTHFYLKDKLAGTPWITKLPFPVQVVSKTIVEEKITDVRFSSSYSYHHGYYDHAEREFRGFGRVDQTDSEHYREWSRNNATNLLEKDEALYQKPVLTKTWYHVGAYQDRERILTQFKEEYWFEEYNRRFPSNPISVTEPELADARLSAEVMQLPGNEYREAIRACKGMVLRQEVFALDASENPTDAELQLQLKPYTVATHNCNIQLLQPRQTNEHGVFLVTESEAITIHYERNIADPRIGHVLNTRIDDLGNIEESVSVVYGRKTSEANNYFNVLTSNITDFELEVLNSDNTKKAQMQNAFGANLAKTKDEQIKNHLIVTNRTFAKYKPASTEFKDIDLPQTYKLRRAFETKTFELTGSAPNTSIFTLDELISDLGTAVEIEYQVNPGSGKKKRLIEHIKVRYLSDSFAPLAYGFFDKLGLQYETYQLAFTSGMLDEIYQKPDGSDLMVDTEKVEDFIESKGKYLKMDGAYWIRSGQTSYKNKVSEASSKVKERFYSPLAFKDALGTVTEIIYDNESLTGTIRNNDGYYIFIRDTLDGLKNKTRVDTFNFRTMSPTRLIDINGNPSSVVLDELGLVKAAAIEGNGVYADATRTSVNINSPKDSVNGILEYTEQSERDLITQLYGSSNLSSTDTTSLTNIGNTLIGESTSRFLFDFRTFQSDGIPISIITINREEHFADNNNSLLQFNFTYVDGLGNVVMNKSQAQGGKAFYIEDGIRKEKNTGNELRWIGNGRTILNNKGKPVKKYEPYFSANFLFENDSQLVEIGVSPFNHYDPLGRIIKIDMPNGTYISVDFNSWNQRVFDKNDNILNSDWYDLRTNPARVTELSAQGKDVTKEKEAAIASEGHANTPNITVFDSLGRGVLSLANNGRDGSGKERLYSTFIDLDVEGNARSVIDARGNVVMSYNYNMLGHRLSQSSMDAGVHWKFNDVLGLTIHSWDQRDHVFETEYDTLHRPTLNTVTGGDGANPLNHIIDRLIYGDESMLANRSNESSHQVKNILGKVVAHYDTAGVVLSPEFDFKGMPIFSTRKLYEKYKELANWTNANLSNELESDDFTFRSKHDALGRITQQITPDGSIITPDYDRTGKLIREHVVHLDPAVTTEYVKGIEYNAKGQRTKIIYGNGVFTKYLYDPLTHRIVRLESKRLNNDPLQDLYYTADPIGNITHIEDKNIPTSFFDNNKISAISHYTYDALYRINSAEGRENDSALSLGNNDNWNDAAYKHMLSAGDPMALRNYNQSFVFDCVGNILQMDHKATGNNWKRIYDYETTNNRLKRTTVGSQNYYYSYHTSHGFITEMPHLDVISYNCSEAVVKSIRQKVTAGNDTAETTYYQYDANGQRVRKITENAASSGTAPTKKDERIYIAGHELYKKHSGTHTGLERRSMSLLDGNHRFVMIESRNNVNDGTLKQVVRYQLGNHLGSASLELDAVGEVISYEEYHPFGTTAFEAKNAAIKAVAKRYRFTGMERDNETGLSYHRARYYIPWLGRWLSSDPIGIGDGLNLYQYTLSSPINNIDSSGTQTTGYERYLERQLSTPEGAERVIEANTSMASALLTPRVVGGLKTVGGGLEVVAGAAGVVAPEPVTTAVGAVAVVHGVDTVQSGLRQLWTGDSTDTMLSEGLQLAGVERNTANLADAGVGILASGGTSLLLRGSSGGMSVAGNADDIIGLADDVPSVSVALSSSTNPIRVAGVEIQVGHNMVGVNTGAGTQWSHLVIGEGGEAIVQTTTLGRGYSVATVPVSAARAEAAAATVTSQVSRGSAGAYTACSTDCATYAAEVLRAGGVTTPRLTTPSVNLVSTALQTPAVGQGAGILATGLYAADATTTATSTNPADFSTFEAYSEAQVGPVTEEFLMEEWSRVHGWQSNAD